MTISIAPPPIEIPGAFAKDRGIGAFFTALLNTIFQLWTATYSIRTTGKVSTTDATGTQIFSVVVNDGFTVMIVVSLAARRTGGSSGTAGDSAFYQLIGAYKNIGGVLTGIGTPSLIAGEDQAGWNVGFTTVGTNAIVEVFGAANNNVTWAGAMSAYAVGG